MTVGAPSDDLFPVTTGLAPGEKVVLNGNFLIDSQAHLSSGMSGLFGGSKEFTTPQANGASAAGNPAASHNKIEFNASPDPMKAGEDNTFEVKLIGADEKPMADAQVTLTFVMPAMPSMNMPEMKNTIPLQWAADRAIYIGKGHPGMAGNWTIIVEARRNDAVIAAFHTHLGAR